MVLTEKHIALMGFAMRKHPGCMPLAGRSLAESFTDAGTEYGLSYWFDIPGNSTAIVTEKHLREEHHAAG